MSSPSDDFARNALLYAQTDAALHHHFLGHLALDLGMPEEAMNQYLQAISKLGDGSKLQEIDIKGSIDILIGLHPNLGEPIVIREKELVHPVKSVFMRVFENTAVRLLSIFTAGFSLNFFV
ncbi:MAG: hypothetical protein ACPGKR_07650 [Poseidonia sp.]|jgi:hypothetical protein